MTGPITSPHRGIGNLLGRMHDQAMRDTLGMPDATRRRCWYGNHSSLIAGGAYFGGKWACVKCKEVAK
jgi:hypothetical protein